MNRTGLAGIIKKKQSFLCVGLDTDINKIPEHLKELDDPLFEFNKAIIDSTKDYAVAYKLNMAFYEIMGSKGWISLEKTIKYLKDTGGLFTIADAKRGDIGNSAKYYAKAFFEVLGFDAVTVNPYMGFDTVAPFLEYNDKFTILLGLTSNKGSSDFQMLKCGDKYLYEDVITKSSGWAGPDQIMYVVGATQPEIIAKARNLVPGNFFLVPGVGAQGGDLASVCAAGLNEQCGLLVNASRSIIYASTGGNFAEKAREAARNMQQQMENEFKNRSFI